MRLWVKAGEALLGSRLGDIPAITVVVPQGMSNEEASRWIQTTLKCRFHARRVPDIEMIRVELLTDDERLSPWR